MEVVVGDQQPAGHPHGALAAAITGQPTHFPTLSIGAIVSNRVVASGAAPLSYQWRRDGVPLDARTSATLILTDLQLADEGDYTVIVTNLGGSVTSQVATLTLDRTFAKITTGASLLTATTTGTAPGPTLTTTGTSTCMSAPGGIPKPTTSITTTVMGHSRGCWRAAR